MTLMKRVNWISVMSFAERYLGLTIIGFLLMVACLRGSANTSQMVAIIISALLCVPVVVVCMYAYDEEEEHHPMVYRLAKPDVLMALAAVVLYINYTAGLLDYIG